MKTMNVKSLAFYAMIFAATFLFIGIAWAFVDVFLLGQGDTMKWGSRLGAFEVAVFFVSLHCIACTLGQVILQAVVNCLSLTHAKTYRVLTVQLSSISCIALLLGTNEQSDWPQWMHLDLILGEIGGLVTEWVVIGFMSGLVWLALLSPVAISSTRKKSA